MPLAPLTRQQKIKHKELIDGYSDFWNNIRFRNGWQTPVFKREEVLHLLDRAAEIVIRKRTLLDKSGNFTMRMIDGSAREFMWGVTQHPTASGDLVKEQEFVRNLVHATFQDANGYVEGLTEAEIDDFILEIEPQLEAELPSTKRICRQLYRIHAVSELFSKEKILSKFLQHNATGSKSLDEISEILGHAEQIALNFSKSFHAFEASLPTKEDEIQIPSIGSSSEEEEEAFVVEKACQQLRNSVNCLPVSKVSSKDQLQPEQQSFNSEQSDNQQTSESTNQEGSSVEDPSQSDCSDLSTEFPNQEINSDSSPLEPPVVDKEEFSSSQPNQTEESFSPSEEQSASQDKEQSSPPSDQVEEQSVSQDKEQSSPPSDQEQSPSVSDEERQRQEMEEIRRKERELQREEANKRKELLERAEKRRIIEEAKRKEQERINKWKQVKWEPRFNISERSDGFLISANVPGLTAENLKIQTDVDRRSLTISGFRYPTAAEEVALEKKLSQTLAARFGNSYDLDAKERESILLRFGSDRFGSFSESYSVPANTNFDDIQSSLEGGVLRIAIPLTQRRQMNPRRSQYGDHYSPYYQPSFFNPRGFW